MLNVGFVVYLLTNTTFNSLGIFFFYFSGVKINIILYISI